MQRYLLTALGSNSLTQLKIETIWKLTLAILKWLYLHYFVLGPGEQGKPAFLGASETENYDSLYKVNGFNAALSDKIALNRAIPDIRHKG